MTVASAISESSRQRVRDNFPHARLTEPGGVLADAVERGDRVGHPLGEMAVEPQAQVAQDLSRPRPPALPHRRLDTEIGPGTTDILIRTEETRPLVFKAGVDNTGTRSTSLYRVNTGVEWADAFGRGDDATANFTTTPAVGSCATM